MTKKMPTYSGIYDSSIKNGCAKEGKTSLFNTDPGNRFQKGSTPENDGSAGIVGSPRVLRLMRI
jgi:hypothetical protein